MISAPALAWAKTPSSPARTARTSGESGTMVATTSASATAPAMSFAPWPPAATSCSTRAGLRLYPVTSNPALTRLAAIGAPMMPSPINPIFVLMNSPPESARHPPRSRGSQARLASVVPVGLYSRLTQPR